MLHCLSYNLLKKIIKEAITSKYIIQVFQHYTIVPGLWGTNKDISSWFWGDGAKFWVFKAQVLILLMVLNGLCPIHIYYLEEYKSTRVNKYKSTRVQEYKSTRVQEYKRTIVQEYKSTTL